jgi:hypothetical protein
MAHEEEPILTHPGTKEGVRHVDDYERFTFLLKWGAIAALVVALFIVFIIL